MEKARAAEEPLPIMALGMVSDPATGPRDLPLADYARRLVVERTGVAAEWPAPPVDWTLERLIHEAGRTSTMPHVLAVAGLFGEPATRDAVISEGIAHEITADLVEQHMPAYAERVRRYGWRVEDVLRANRCEGRSLCVPMQFGFDEFPALVDHPGAKFPAACYYAFGMRDDVLTRIFPGARTEAQLEGLLVSKGSLGIHDLVDDISLRSLEDLRRYLAKVKALGVTVDGAPLVPGTLTATFENLWSLYWSLASAAGLFYDRPFIVGDPPEWDRTAVFWLTADCQRYLRWWNRIYHEGLVGEPFSLSDRELVELQRQGRSAVINDWGGFGGLGDAGDARRAARQRGFGYRYFPVFYGVWSDIWDNYTQPVAHRETPLVFTRRLRGREELGRVMRWADWYLGDERDTLASWGMPDWYTGSGADRRFTWKCAALEDWAVYGITSDRDGDCVGLEHTPALAWDPSRNLRLPLGPVSFFAPESAYPDAPYWVYPRDGRKVLRTKDFRAYCTEVMRAARYDEYLVMYRGQHHREKLYLTPEISEFFLAADQGSPEFSALVRDIITAPADRFEGAYQALRKFHLDRGYEKARRAFIAYLRDAYPTLIEPNIFVDRRARA